MDAHNALMAAGIVFGIVAFMHLLRLVFKWDVIIAGKVISKRVSLVALIFSLALSIWMFMAVSS